MNKVNTILLTALAITLSSCIAVIENKTANWLGVSYYQDSQNEETANLRVIQQYGVGFWLHDKACFNRGEGNKNKLTTPIVSSGTFIQQMQNIGTIYQEKNLGMPFPPEKNATISPLEFKVSANQLQLLSYKKVYTGAAGQYSCHTQVAPVIFEKGKNYELVDAPTTQFTCNFTVSEILTDGTRKVLDTPVLPMNMLYCKD